MIKITPRDLEDACRLVYSSTAISRKGDQVTIIMDDNEEPYLIVGMEKRYVKNII